MNLVIRKAAIFYVSAILFTWICWIVPIVYAVRNEIPLYYNEGVYNIFTADNITLTQIVLFLIFALAPYGPLFGVVVANFLTQSPGNEDTREKRNYQPVKWLLLILFYPIVIFGIALMITTLMNGFRNNFLAPVIPFWFLPFLFLFQLITSGLEEIGWRGYLQPVLNQRYIAERSIFIVGVLWSIWHYPFIVFINWQFGPAIILLNLAGFTLVTIPQAYILGFLYNSTKSVLLCVILHAWSNTVSAYLLSAAPLPQIAPIIVSISLWLIAQYLVRRYGKENLSTV